MTAEEVAEVGNRVRAGGCQIAGALPIRARRPGAEAIQREAAPRVSLRGGGRQ
jgi:hypothetical protein